MKKNIQKEIEEFSYNYIKATLVSARYLQNSLNLEKSVLSDFLERMLVEEGVTVDQIQCVAGLEGIELSAPINELKKRIDDGNNS
jgi:hypothetical protein